MPHCRCWIGTPRVPWFETSYLCASNLRVFKIHSTCKVATVLVVHALQRLVRTRLQVLLELALREEAVGAWSVEEAWRVDRRYHGAER